MNAHAVMNLIALLQPTKDCDRGLHRGFAHKDLLKASLKCWVFFDVLAELIKRGCTHHAQFTASEHGLEHIAGVHRTFTCCSSTHDSVHLINKGDDLAVRFFDLGEHGLQSFFEVTPELCAGYQRAHVECNHALVSERIRNIAVHYALRKPFDDCCLSYTRLANQHRVVLATTRQNLDHAANLFVTTNDWIKLAFTRSLGQVLAIFVECLQRVLRVLRGDPLAAPHFE